MDCGTEEKAVGSLLCLLWSVWLFAVSGPVFAFDLITENEAAGVKKPFTLDSAAIGRGQKIEVREPKSSVYTTNPFKFEVRFTAFGGAKIDLETIEILYWNFPRRDLTPRLKTFYSDSSIKISNARAPIGDHQIR